MISIRVEKQVFKIYTTWWCKVYNVFFIKLIIFKYVFFANFQGDSGGPLQCRLTKTGPWILAGITSFGSGCSIEGYPDVYTRTSHYMKWIQDTIAFE